MTYFHRIIFSILSFIIILALIDYNNIDLKFQSLFFISEKTSWLVDRNDMFLKFIFYKLPKYIIIAYGVSLILWFTKIKISNQDLELQKKLIFLVLALICTPLIVALFKHYSPMYCPNNIDVFGGKRSYLSIFDIFDNTIFFNNYGKCFPAGHASGGFALISLYFVMPNNILKYSSLALSLVLGSIMGLYQIAKGAHYLSDTIATLILAYIVSIVLHSILLREK